MLQKSFGMVALDSEGLYGNAARTAIIKHPWTIQRDEYLLLRRSGPGFIIMSSDDSTSITKILVSSSSIAVQFRDLKKHQEVIAKSKHRGSPLPDDLFMSVDDEDEANTLYVSWKCYGDLTDKAKNVALFFNLLTQIENDEIMNALCCLCHYLDEENDRFVDALLAFNEVIQMLDKRNYALYTDINFTEESRWYFITELMNRANSNECENQSELFLIVASLCSDILSSSSHYKEANQRLLELTYNFDPSDNETPKIQRLETRLRCALRAENQRLIDLTFHELCHEPGIAPNLLNIQGDEDTLIKLATLIREKNAMIAQLSTKPKPIQEENPARFDFSKGF